MKNPLMPRWLSWPWVPVLLVTAGLVLTGVPEHREGPTLVALTAKHGLTLANALAFLFLAAGITGLCLGMWANLDVTLNTLRRRPLPIFLLLAQLGVGMLFLYASGASTMLRWWAPGVTLSTLALLGLAAVTATAEQT